MAGPNIGSSVVRRDSRSLSRVHTELSSNGWVQSGSLGDSIVYMENSGFSLTLVRGAAGTLVFPSGPVRGRLFGSSGLELGMDNLSLRGLGNGSMFNLGGRGNGPLGMGMMSRSTRSPSSDTSSDEREGEPEQPQRKNTRSSGEADFV
jgi:hypothetical protein